MYLISRPVYSALLRSLLLFLGRLLKRCANFTLYPFHSRRLFSEKLPPRPELTDEDRKLIKSSAPLLAPDRLGVRITTRMYERMFLAYPILKNIFSHSKQTTGKQPLLLATSVYAYASNIDDLSPILPFVEQICHKHASLHITPGMYNVVGTYLLEAITEILQEAGTKFEGSLKEAWVRGYWNIAYFLIDREEQLYKSAAWLGWKPFKVARRVKQSDDISSFYLAPVDGSLLPPYKPGLYISVQLAVDGLGYKQSRQYSLSDSPRPEHYRISVKRELEFVTACSSDGVTKPSVSRHPVCVSHILHDKVREGDTVEVAYPFGDFFMDDSTSPIVLLSAGVGLTPILSMLNTLAAEGKRPNRQVSWIQGMRTPRDHAFLPHIRSLAQKYPEEVKTAIFYSALVGGDELQKGDYKGRMNLLCEDWDRGILHLNDKGSRYYMCGPVPFMDAVTEQLKGLGVEGERIHAEVFVP